jgi:tetratricopeptide (TPR) repeat protein
MQRPRSSDDGDDQEPVAPRHESGIAPAHPHREETDVAVDLDADAEANDDESIERFMAEAYSHMASGDLESARDCYLAAARQLAHEETARRALVLVSLGDIARAEGRIDESVAWFDKALAIAPRHIGALRARAELARASGESAVAAAMLHRLVGSLETDAERIEVFSSIAAESLSAARDAIRRALILAPGDRSLLERLWAVHEACDEWDEAVGIAVEVAESTTDRGARARALVEAARLCRERTDNTARAVALYEAAIEDDPEVPGAFQAIEQELIRVQDFRALSAAYERQIGRLPEAARGESCRLLGQLARVQWEQLNDPKGALAALARLVVVAPLDPAARLAQAELLSASGDHAGAVHALEVAAELLPSRVQTYHRLYELFSVGSDEDRAYAACSALVALGEANIDEQLVYAQHSPSTALAPRHRMTAELWDKLAPAEHSPLIDRLARALEPAALDAWFAEHPDRSGERISERLRQHPAKTTVSAARCAVWAAELLGVPEPLVYTQADNDRVSVATLPQREHAILLGRHVLAGRSMAELSFILARHLSYARPGYRILTFYASLGELEAIVRAGIALAGIEITGRPDASARVARLTELLSPRLDAAARAEIGQAVRALPETQGPVDLVGWARGVETIACRAGLLASGDATVASAALALSGAPVGGLSARDRALALLPFTVSERYAKLRQALGISVN